MNPENNPYERLNIVRATENALKNNPRRADLNSIVHETTTELLNGVLKNNEMIAVGLVGIAGVAQYMSSNDIGNQALMDFVVEKSLGTAGTVFVSGQLYDHFILHRSRESGRAEVPSSWSGHSIVFDPHRDVFDAISRNRPDRNHVLMHDGSLLNGDRISGNRLNPIRERHLSSGGQKYLSDNAFLKKAHPEYSGGIFLNFWNPENALYQDSCYPESPSSLRPERALNILLSIASGWKYKHVGIVAPLDMQWNGQPVQNVFNSQNFPEFRNVQVFTPESIFETQLTEQVMAIQSATNKQVSVAVDSDNELLSQQFCSRLTSKGLQIKDANIANLTVIDRLDDDAVIARAWELRNSNKPRIAVLERYENVPEAESIGAYAWCLPDMVAHSIPYEQMSKRY